MAFDIGAGATLRTICLDLPCILSAEEFGETQTSPFSFSRIASRLPADATLREPGLAWLWLFRDCFYVAERDPSASESDEVRLRIKSLHYQRDAELKRLEAQVANFEAAEDYVGSDRQRRPIRDDVKLVVWTRDMGACVRCGSQNELHFDHVIPLAKGGSDEAENIQLLCRSCNLAKGDRLV